MEPKLLIRIKDYTLAKLLAAISIAGLIIVAAAAVFNVVRMNGRDAARVEDIATIKLALVTYLRYSATGYPASTGECLSADFGVGKELMDAKVWPSVPVDPLWSEEAPAQTNGALNAGQTNFCYFYFSGASDRFKINFFLESDSKAGRSGPHFITQ